MHIATDQLLEGKHVIHVSFASDTTHIISWYEDIFEEMSRRYGLDGAMDVHDDMIKNRVIMNFRQDRVSAPQVQRSIGSMIKDGNFNADVVIVDGLRLSKNRHRRSLPDSRNLPKKRSLNSGLARQSGKNAPQSKDSNVPDLLAPFLP